MDLPPDRSGIATEARHDASIGLDRLSTSQIVDLIVADNRYMTDAVAVAAPRIAALVDDIVPRFHDGGRLVYLGAGTSGRLGVLDASECPPTFQSDPMQVIGIIAGGDAALRRSSEGREDEIDGANDDLAALHLGPLDTVIGIAAGGTTPYVLGGVAYAGRAGSVTGLITCTAFESPPDIDYLILLETGPELLTGSTRMKAGSATKLALNAISTALFVGLGKVYCNLMVDLRATNAKLRDRAIRILREFMPALDRAEAAARLDAADGELKTAIVMCRLGVDVVEARLRLVDAGGRLRDVIG